MKNALYGLIAVAAFPSTAFAQDLPLGTWARGDGNARVRIEKCGAAICAINTWIKDTSGGENVGDRLVMSVTPAGAKKLDGTAFDPQRNKNYKISISFGDSAMTTRGCILGVLCKSTSWSRLN
ncbi:MAG: DUF2147 domain-containing protein [Beijerinckiaceae bacterium]